ncbi:MAG TPA: 3'-5' exonuclease domain-containing protein 2 [Rhodocyclaceae bacterium]|nr:3'-5' exonuclease domain-containing protein 2 [Rhodocyclaceae bacterium]
MKAVPTVPAKEAIAAMPPFQALHAAQVRLVTAGEEAEVAAVLRAHACLGFDTESRPTFHKGQNSDGPHLVQFAVADRAWLFQTRTAAAQAAVAAILHDPVIAKVGFGLANDTSQLAAKFGIHPHNLVDLDRHFRRLGHRNSVGARGAIALLFEQRFVKSKRISTSNWSLAQLSEAQLLYAANDAYAAYRVFEALRTLLPDMPEIDHGSADV